MSDPGIRAAERGEVAIERRIRSVYRKAQEEVKQYVARFNIRFMREDEDMRKKVAEKVITEEEYKRWLKQKVYRGKQWDEVVDHCTEVLTNANKTAVKIIRGEQIGVFAENMAFQAFQLEKGIGENLGFGLYSSQTVSNLLKKMPELLPRKVINGVKDRAWNKNKISNEITKSIIKGDGIPTIADSLSKALGVQNNDAMTRYARTAMTSAQNAGRMEMLHEADDDGIHTKKKWIATLDSRTRDAHADLDGETAEIDEPFHNELGDIMFPGDPSADPGNVYNCRCTLGYVVEGYESKGDRRAYREWDDDRGHHKESYLIKDMTYKEWKAWKEGRE